MRAKSALLLLLVIAVPGVLARTGEVRKKPAPAKRSVVSRTTAASIPFQVRQALNTSSEVLLGLIRKGSNPIPLAALNATKCVAFINSKGAANATGIVSCRLSPNDWTAPAFASLQQDNPAEASTKRELLVLLMSDRAVQSLLGGQLKLGEAPASAPGPLAPRQSQLKESDIHADTFTYDRRGTSALAAEAVHGTMTPDESNTAGLYAGKTTVRTVLTGHSAVPRVAAAYVTAVASFFNTITPTGIIVHHSAALPSNNRVPTSEHAVDMFHESRGFAVACFGRIYHVAYHYFILPDGKVKAGRPENCQGAHAHGYNSYLGISLAGDFSTADNRNGRKGLTKPTAAQMASLVTLSRRLMRKYGIPEKRVLRHSDVSNTRCPGDRFPFAALQRQLKATELARQRRR